MNDLGDVLGEIGFHHVSLYEGHRTILEDVHLTIPAHSTVAIVGKRASGKVALTRLIQRFRDPCEGTITIDGIDVRTICLESLRQIICVETLEGGPFQGSVSHGLKLNTPIMILEEAVTKPERGSELFLRELLEACDTGENGVDDRAPAFHDAIGR